ncbi:hypothetical protein Btru_071948 [Bulinus truncatus]|nr:hypothetical protein Btru_071948 [Bulinus truncatus]
MQDHNQVRNTVCVLELQGAKYIFYGYKTNEKRKMAEKCTKRAAYRTQSGEVDRTPHKVTRHSTLTDNPRERPGSVASNFSSHTYGAHEVQEFSGEEAELQNYLSQCTKNPNHDNFIPVQTFSLQHLPDGYREEEMLDFIRAVAALTARLDVRETSPNRPEFWPDTDAPFPFHNCKSGQIRIGSGRVMSMVRYSGTGDQRGRRHNGGQTSCACHKCQTSETPSEAWAELDLVTAAHVVFDDVEAGRKSCRLFCDGPDSHVVLLERFRVVSANVRHDKCLLRCSTCDPGLIDALSRMLRTFDGAWKRAYNRYWGRRDEVRLTFIVSHPHGCYKQVSVGRWVETVPVGGERYTKKFTYTTGTCPGSSGATVNIVGHCGGSFKLRNHLVHGGALKGGLNYSGTGCVYIEPQDD